jgi:hypothetical protein
MEYVRFQCLQKRPDRRYVSGTELHEDLMRSLNCEAVRAGPVRGWERAWKWAKRRPALAALFAVIVVATVGLLGGRRWFRAALAEERNQAIRARDDAEQARNEAQQRAIKEKELRQAVEQEKAAAEGVGVFPLGDQFGNGLLEMIGYPPPVLDGGAFHGRSPDRPMSKP